MKALHAIAISSAALLTALAAPQSHATTQTSGETSTEALVTSQLPRNAVPTHYTIAVTPDAEKLSYTGKVSIDVTLKETSDSVTLNAADIAFHKATIRSGTKVIGSIAVTVDADAQSATLKFPKSLKAGNYTLDIDYSGKIYQQANGMFALDYTDTAGAKKRALFTQFEAPDARRFVPSWDEPNYKATFDLTATVPSDLMAVSNMPISAKKDLGNGKSEVTFARSPKMSTYLLFFGLGEFDRISKKVGSTEVGVIMGKGNAAKGQFALESSAKAVEYYNEYFDVPFPLPKLDNVAGPGQSQFFSAMENWGAIFSFERALLDDPKFTSARQRQSIFSTDAHEIAHQWFGDLVTMQWWDDLWLNEGFASWMANKATQKFYPEWQTHLDKVGAREGAMVMDSVATTHPVIQSIKTVEQSSQAFDAITYSKGSAVITMLENYAGADVWRDGLRVYMKKHAYGNTRTDDLWNAVEGAGAKGLVKIAHDFTKQPGIPMLTVSGVRCVNGSTIVNVTQGEFSRDRKTETDSKPLQWNVPVIAKTLGGEAVSNIVSGGKGEITVPGCGSLLLNAGQAGYYRVLYTPEMAAALQRDLSKLDAVDQLGVLSDNSALSKAGYQPMAIAMDILNNMPVDSGQKVTENVIGAWGNYYRLFKGDDKRQGQIAAIASKRFAPILAKLGMAPIADEPLLDSNLRSALITVLGGMGDKSVLAEGDRLFSALDSDPAALDGPLRSTWLNVIAYNANQATWDKMRKLAREATNQPIKASTYGLLGSVKDDKLAQAALDLALTDEPGPTISPAMISSVAGEHPEMAIDFALGNLDKVEKLVDVSSRSRYIARLGGSSNNAATPAKLDAYAKEHLTPTSRKPVDQTINSIETRLKTDPVVRQGVAEWLDKKPK